MLKYFQHRKNLFKKIITMKQSPSSSLCLFTTFVRLFSPLHCFLQPSKSPVGGMIEPHVIFLFLENFYAIILQSKKQVMRSSLAFATNPQLKKTTLQNRRLFAKLRKTSGFTLLAFYLKKRYGHQNIQNSKTKTIFLNFFKFSQKIKNIQTQSFVELRIQSRNPLLPHQSVGLGFHLEIKLGKFFLLEWPRPNHVAEKFWLKFLIF